MDIPRSRLNFPISINSPMRSKKSSVGKVDILAIRGLHLPKLHFYNRWRWHIGYLHLLFNSQFKFTYRLVWIYTDEKGLVLNCPDGIIRRILIFELTIELIVCH